MVEYEIRKKKNERNTSTTEINCPRCSLVAVIAFLVKDLYSR